MSRLSEVLSGIPAEVMAVCNDILKLAKKQLGRLPDEVYLALLDHCHFAIERQRQGIALHNALQWEMRRLYPTEFALGRQALALIEQQLGLSLPEDEAGFIAWHLVNAQLNSEASEMQAINQLMRQILRIVKDQQGLELDEQALNYHRFIAHLKFCAARVVPAAATSGRPQPARCGESQLSASMAQRGVCWRLYLGAVPEGAGTGRADVPRHPHQPFIKQSFYSPAGLSSRSIIRIVTV